MKTIIFKNLKDLALNAFYSIPASFVVAFILWVVRDVIFQHNFGYMSYVKYVFIICIILCIVAFFVGIIGCKKRAESIAKKWDMSVEDIIEGIYRFKIGYKKGTLPNKGLFQAQLNVNRRCVHNANRD